MLRFLIGRKSKMNFSKSVIQIAVIAYMQDINGTL